LTSHTRCAATVAKLPVSNPADSGKGDHGRADWGRDASKPSVGDGGKPLAAFARRAKIPFHAVPSPGKPTPEAPHLHINNVNAYHSRLKQWLNRFNGVATKNLPSGGAPSTPGAKNSIRQSG
jgi:hypothetical protein